jgi:phage baseplate assembly protein W
MADGLYYGISFPFMDSTKGTYFRLTETSNDEIRSNLIHLLLTRKGTRYYLPNFGTRLLEFIFEPMDGSTFSDLESEIRDSVEEYIPNIIINSININPASDGLEDKGFYVNENDLKVFTVPNIATAEHTAKIKIDYTITDGTFSESDFVIINV